MYRMMFDGSEYRVDVSREKTPYHETIITVQIYAPNGEFVGAGAYETGTVDPHSPTPANGRTALRRAIYRAAGQWIDRQHHGHRFWGVFKRRVKAEHRLTGTSSF